MLVHDKSLHSEDRLCQELLNLDHDSIVARGSPRGEVEAATRSKRSRGDTRSDADQSDAVKTWRRDGEPAMRRVGELRCNADNDNADERQHRQAKRARLRRVKELENQEQTQLAHVENRLRS